MRLRNYQSEEERANRVQTAIPAKSRKSVSLCQKMHAVKRQRSVSPERGSRKRSSNIKASVREVVGGFESSREPVRTSAILAAGCRAI